ncbi:MAG: alpha/beta fold hydrolase [Candidatus Poseidoniaceae archaeon]|nr:alpha/beta fold hydrolase [Candidatus Poseidoniaceae archaeon]HII87396.1 alpha/beta fold hydrolase [Candidatus Poseidoniaceae archaeon]
MPTLIMMHGMTGNAAMMRPFAEKVLPEGWTLIVPEARYTHPRRGRTWWRYEDEDADATRRMNLSRRELIDVDSSLSQLEQLIAEHAPMGSLVVGGFSQGGAMAQEMLQLPMADRIIGVVAIGTRLVRGMELGVRLAELDSKHLFWMHGERDLRVSIQDGWAVVHTFEAAGWALELIEHKKGHMIPMEHHDALKEWLTALGQVSI